MLRSSVWNVLQPDVTGAETLPQHLSAIKRAARRLGKVCSSESSHLSNFATTARLCVRNCAISGGIKKIIFRKRPLFYLPAYPLPGILLSKVNISEHFSRSTCPVRQSSVMIWRALLHKAMLSSVRKLMSLLLSHCTPDEPGGWRFIWAPDYAPRSAAGPRERAGRRAAS